MIMKRVRLASIISTAVLVTASLGFEVTLDEKLLKEGGERYLYSCENSSQDRLSRDLAHVVSLVFTNKAGLVVLKRNVLVTEKFELLPSREISVFLKIKTNSDKPLEPFIFTELREGSIVSNEARDVGNPVPKANAPKKAL